MMIQSSVDFGYHSQFVVSFHPGNGSLSLWTLSRSPKHSSTLIYTFILDPAAPSYKTCLKSEFRLILFSISLEFLSCVFLLFSITIMSCIVAWWENTCFPYHSALILLATIYVSDSYISSSSVLCGHPTGCPPMQFNSVTVYLELASDATG